MDAVEELRAIDAIRQLKSRYFRYLDTKDWEGMETIFCDDVVFDLRAGVTTDPEGGGLGTENLFRSRDAFLDFIRPSMAGSVSVHHGHGHEVSIDGPDKAHGVIAMEDQVVRADNGELILEGYGHYHEEYRRVAGEWRIARSRLSRLKVKVGPGFALA
jgi:hypothetical protein